MTDYPRHIARALLSVSDKTGLVDFARALATRGIELVSTGGTRKTLTEAGLPVRDVAELTGFPEMMDGRVKTLHPEVHGGLLAIRENRDHAASMRAHGIEPIDLLVVNLYPFESTVRERRGLRHLHREHRYRRSCDDPRRGKEPSGRRGGGRWRRITRTVLAELAQHQGATTLSLRKKLAAKAYARTAAYDAAISNWFAEQLADPAPTYRAIGGRLIEALRYGENPHQAAAFYRTGDARFGVASARQEQGKQLSYNNINDTDAAYECVAEFDPARTPACAIIKHANPCGVAEGASPLDAYSKALRCDPVSAYGGIVAFNRTLDAEAARAVTDIFTEVIIAPAATDEAIAIIGAKKNLRLLLAGGLPDPRATGLIAKTVAGGLLVSSRDNAVVDDMSLKTVTRRAPTNAELHDLAFAFRVAKHVKSNTIVYAKDLATVGIGAGQMSRVDSARIAARKAQDAAREEGLAEPRTKGSVVASDAFFPFAGRSAGGDRSRRHGGDPARRLDARRRSDQGRRRSRDRDGVHRHAPFPTLSAGWAIVLGRPAKRDNRKELAAHSRASGNPGQPAANRRLVALGPRFRGDERIVTSEEPSLHSLRSTPTLPRPRARPPCPSARSRW